MVTRILVVDDTRAIRDAVRLYLEPECDLEICGEAENGKLAIDRVRELEPDVVLLDLSMPVMNGLDAARIIKSITPGIHILMLTLHTYPGLALEARKVGIDRVLSKDGSVGPDVLQAVRTVMAA